MIMLLPTEVLALIYNQLDRYHRTVYLRTCKQLRVSINIYDCLPPPLFNHYSKKRNVTKNEDSTAIQKVKTDRVEWIIKCVINISKRHHPSPNDWTIRAISTIVDTQPILTVAYNEIGKCVDTTTMEQAWIAVVMGIVLSGKIGSVKCMLDDYKDTGFCSNTTFNKLIISYSVISGSIELVEWLEENGYVYDMKTVDHLTYITDNGNNGIIRWLLDRDIFYADSTTVNMLLYDGDLTSLKTLYERGYWNPIGQANIYHRAATLGHANILEWLHEIGYPLIPTTDLYQVKYSDLIQSDCRNKVAVLKTLRLHGYLPDNDMYQAAIVSNSRKLLAYLLDTYPVDNPCDLVLTHSRRPVKLLWHLLGKGYRPSTSNVIVDRLLEWVDSMTVNSH